VSLSRYVEAAFIDRVEKFFFAVMKFYSDIVAELSHVRGSPPKGSVLRLRLDLLPLSVLVKA
jgi:hypothetical protein